MDNQYSQQLGNKLSFTPISLGIVKGDIAEYVIIMTGDLINNNERNKASARVVRDIKLL